MRAQDLGHYGRVDHLAPAGDCEAFETYVKEQDAAKAHACFAPLRAALGNRACPVEVLYGKAALEARLAVAQAAGADVLTL